MDHVLSSPAPLLTRTSRPLVWTGRVLGGLVIAFLLFDAIAKLMLLAPVVEGTVRVGYPIEVIRPLGVLLATCTILYAIPRTQVLGALLLTAYLGGATATHVRLEQPFWMPIAMGVVLWAALCLRNARVRAILLAPTAA
jgi:hypothetical protein